MSVNAVKRKAVEDKMFEDISDNLQLWRKKNYHLRSLTNICSSNSKIYSTRDKL
jgi:hypothetical protein